MMKLYHLVLPALLGMFELAKAVAPAPQERNCTPGLHYCGHGLLRIGRE